MLKVTTLVLAAAAALGMSSAIAQTSGPGGFNTSTSGNTTSHTYAASGSSDLSRIMRGGYDPVTNQSGFQELLQKKGFTPKGSSYDYKVTKPVPKAAMAKALAKTLPIVGNMLAMKELLDALYGPGKATWDDADGQWETTQSGGYTYSWNGQFSSATCSGVAAALDAAYPIGGGATRVCTGVASGSTGIVRACSSTNMNICNDIQYVGSTPVTAPVTEQSLEEKINSGPSPLPLPVDQLLDQIPPAAKQQLARDIAADTANPPRSVPVSPAGVESPSGLNVPESTTTSSGTDSLGRPFTRTTVVQTIARTLPSGQIQHDTTTTTTTTTQTGTNPDGSPITETTTGTETTSTTPTPPPPTTANPNVPTTGEDLECGLPGTPPCKIDESGTPPPGDANFDAADAEIQSFKSGLYEALQVELDKITHEWTWTFQLPTGCSALQFDTLVGKVVQIDMCQFQPMIHEIMSMLWAAAGVWGALMIFLRANG